ncbi:Pre-rRNA-processing protein las1 [Spathaspora sp. JA1]|nr:Pre-rRNA-processing protein las1 [Spathaspora sp. JA1]
MNTNPVVTAYRSVDDLKTVKDWFYNFTPEKDNRKRAIDKVKAWSSRARIPHGLEATSLLTSIHLSDNESHDASVVQLSYSMALIRFVNGLLDPFQQSNYAIPLHHLAKSVNLPSYFVELRHMATHEGLPSLPMLRIACTSALNWLYDHYWCHIEEDEENVGELDALKQDMIDKNVSESELRYVTETVGQIKADLDQFQVVNNLKVFKKLRKQNLDIIMKLGDNSNETAVKYSKCVSKLKSFVHAKRSKSLDLVGLNYSMVLARVLVHQYFIIYNYQRVQDKKIKFNPLVIKLYRPLFDTMGFLFKIRFMITIMDILTVKPRRSIVEDLIFQKLQYLEITQADEIVQLMEWLNYFVEESLISPNTRDYNIEELDVTNRGSFLTTIIEKLQEVYEHLPSEIACTSMIKVITTITNVITNKKFKNFYNQDKLQELETWKKHLINLQDTKASYDLPPSLDEILGGSDIPLSVSPTPVPLSASSSTSTSVKRNLEDNNEQVKKQKKEEQKLYFFEVHENWKPTPFGTSI